MSERHIEECNRLGALVAELQRENAELRKRADTPPVVSRQDFAVDDLVHDVECTAAGFEALAERAHDATLTTTDCGVHGRLMRKVAARLKAECAPKMADPAPWPTREDFDRMQDHANAVSRMHGEMWNVARELFDMVKNGERLAPKGIETYEKLIYGEPRQVKPHRSGDGAPPKVGDQP